MASMRVEKVEGLQITLNDQEVGVLTHYTGGKNILSFSPDFAVLDKCDRPIVSFTQLIRENYFELPQVSTQRLSPVLSNLLPEGALRDFISRELKVHSENEFPLMVHLGANLPGALKAVPIAAGELPAWALAHREKVEAVQVNIDKATSRQSLAGIQMKFSSVRAPDKRFNINEEDNSDSWIIKVPSNVYKQVPANEYTAMRLAESVGIDIPEIQLVKLTQLHNLPDIRLPDEEYAYAIRRFDRSKGKRIHTEDFAQVFELYSHEKYEKKNYEQIVNAIYLHSPQGLKNAQKMAKRLLGNILLANGDAHLKNWSLIYLDGITPQLSPAYDIVSTLPYVKGENGAALNMAKVKNWYETNMETFKKWAERADVPWQPIAVHLSETMEQARELWPTMLNELPMLESSKQVLKEHWRELHSDFRIG
ncbi:type II toxin-antitoxin system HipA family toxin [Idiomarina sp. 29L]|uniref:type II toxin-antitoxin system HipA family toxin n=1 Tax=Idiomarina sp. 29L TaxID=2508877 RepID=UPI001012FABB|nr:type II toxin-antitoxin system HipA family toxin [Idiomarina sp. 29L]RXS44169.1 type II toxin-antitoxin system HipA family toxin [Idiomarina sp. 29L]